MNNIIQTSTTGAARAVKTFVAMNQPVFLWGSPGIGKSQLIAQVADDLGALMVDFRLSQIDAVDLHGLPDVDTSTSTATTTWRVPSTLPFEGTPFDTPDNRERIIVLFLDEAMQAPPSVQAVAFQLVLDKRIGEHKLMPNVRIVAASNRETDRAGTNRMLTPLANRFAHLDVTASLDPWVEWARENGIHPAVEAYVRFRPDYLDTFEAAQVGNHKAFATPRSWEVVSRVLHMMTDARTRVIEDKATTHLMVSGTVGAGVGSELLAFVDTWESMPSIDNILKHPDKAPVPDEPSMLFAVTAALGHRATKDNLDAIMDYADRLPKEYAIKLAMDIGQRAKKGGNSSIMGHKAMTAFIVKHGSLIL